MSRDVRIPSQIKQGVARPEGSERAVQTLHVEGIEELVRALVAA
jgi:hypothetical protein